jgi:hypothetical protein
MHDRLGKWASVFTGFGVFFVSLGFLGISLPRSLVVVPSSYLQFGQNDIESVAPD